jgi:hypothetical protein
MPGSSPSRAIPSRGHLKTKPCAGSGPRIQGRDNCHGGAPVSTSDWRRGQHAADESLAALSIRFKTNKSKL